MRERTTTPAFGDTMIGFGSTTRAKLSAARWSASMVLRAVVLVLIFSGTIRTSFASDPMRATASPLGDMAIGAVDAPVTVIEYASMTCSHCAAFHRDIYPKLKARYIDTGRVRFVFREFPLDIKAAAGSMLARCIAKDDAQVYFATVAALFTMQDAWVPAKSAAALKQIAKQAGLSEWESEACLGNADLLAAIKQTREDAVSKLDVKSTPSFFIDGNPLLQGTTFEAFEDAIERQRGNPK